MPFYTRPPTPYARPLTPPLTNCSYGRCGQLFHPPTWEQSEPSVRSYCSGECEFRDRHSRLITDYPAHSPDVRGSSAHARSSALENHWPMPPIESIPDLEPYDDAGTVVSGHTSRRSDGFFVYAPSGQSRRSMVQQNAGDRSTRRSGSVVSVQQTTTTRTYPVDNGGQVQPASADQRRGQRWHASWPHHNPFQGIPWAPPVAPGAITMVPVVAMVPVSPLGAGSPGQSTQTRWPHLSHGPGTVSSTTRTWNVPSANAPGVPPPPTVFVPPPTVFVPCLYWPYWTTTP